jgi:hypothetical protein
MCDAGIVVTENEPRPQRPDSTAAQEAAEIRAQETIRELDAGLISKPKAVGVKQAAERAIRDHDLKRGLGNLP